RRCGCGGCGVGGLECTGSDGGGSGGEQCRRGSGRYVRIGPSARHRGAVAGGAVRSLRSQGPGGGKAGGLTLGGGSKAKAPGGGAASLSLGGGTPKPAESENAAPSAEAENAPEKQEQAPSESKGSAPKAPGGGKSGGLTLGGGSKAKAPGGGAAAVALGGGAAAAGAAAASTSSSEESDGPDDAGVTGTAAPAEESTPAPAAEKAPSETVEAAEPQPAGPTPPARAVKFVERFLSRHGGTADVVVQPVGRRGIRLTLVGADGTMGDKMVDTLSQAEALVESVEGLSGSDWTRELISRVDVPENHWKRMAGPGALV